MHAEQRYRINSPFVVHETIEGEVIMVNLDTGSYYSLDGAGAVLWEHLEKGASLPDAIEAIRGRYDAAPGAIESASEALLAALVAEDLLKEFDGVPVNGSAAPTPVTRERAPFVAPTLNKHTDMQDLLLLDPIHEVDQAGWPAVKP
jgi:hypothetical protein